MKRFEQELESLKRRVMEMGKTTEEMVALSSAALIDKDTSAMESVLAHEAMRDISKMSEITRGMVRNALDAFDQEDIGKAELVLECDDEVDQLYNQTFSDLLEDTADDDDRLSRSMNLILVAR